MNTSTFMDKQIMDLTASGQAQSASLKSTTTNNNSSSSSGDYIDLANHRQRDNDDDDEDGLTKDHIQPSYDFQPIRPIIQSASPTSSLGVSRVLNSVTPSPPPPPTKNYGSLEYIDPAKGTVNKDRNAHDELILREIDQTMKKYTDSLLHALESVSARMTQLETRTRNLENLVDDINVAVGNNHGSIDGKLRHLENILREVQTGVQVLRDKHEIIEAQLELSKLQVSHTKQQSENLKAAGSNSVPQTISAPLQETASQQQVPSTPQQGYQQLPPPVLPPSFPMPQNAAAPPTPQSQPLAPQLQMPNQMPQNQVPHPAQYPPHGQTQDVPNQHYQHNPIQQSLPHPSSAPPHQYPGSYPSYSQQPQQPQQQSSMPAPIVPSQGPPPVTIHQEEAPYIPSQSYGPPLHQALSRHPSAGAQSQQYYGGPPPQVYDMAPPKSNLGYPSGYSAPTGPNEPYPYGGSAQYGSGSKPKQTSYSGSGYPQLPTARILPQAIPTASAVSGGSGSSATGSNRVPVDDVIDKVSSMGFSREQVRATVRRLTDNGQSVDLNIVLDKLMNG